SALSAPCGGGQAGGAERDGMEFANPPVQRSPLLQRPGVPVSGAAVAGRRHEELAGRMDRQAVEVCTPLAGDLTDPLARRNVPDAELLVVPDDQLSSVRHEHRLNVEGVRNASELGQLLPGERLPDDGRMRGRSRSTP